jgi:hypothetical protein
MPAVRSRRDTSCRFAEDGSWGEALNALVLQYLVHSGYLETAEALQAASNTAKMDESTETMHGRQRMDATAQ